MKNLRAAIITILCLLFFIPLKAQVWNKLGDGFYPIPSTVYSVGIYNNKLILGGGFKLNAQMLEQKLAVWNGSSLDSFPLLIGPRVGFPYTIKQFDNHLMVGGNFVRIGTLEIGSDTTVVTGTKAIAAWDGNQWSSVGGGFLGGTVYSLENFNNSLYVGGGFSATQNLSNLNSMARWDGSQWHNVGTGIYGDFKQVRAMAVYNDNLYIAGCFTKAGGIPAFNIAGWDGTQYFDLDTGVLGDVYSLLVDSINNFLYVGGQIYHAGGNNGDALQSHVAQWDGYEWNSVGINPQLNTGGNALALYYNQLYAAAFNGTDTIISRFDGNQWYWVPGPIASIACLEVYNGELYAGGGYILTTSGDTAWGAARYYTPPDTTSCLFIQALIHAMPFGTKEEADTIYTTAPYHIQFYTNNKYASSWAWDFGDGGTANTREPAHTYAAPGTYNVTLEVIHPHNLSSQVCTLNVAKTITIIDNTAVEETTKDTIEYLGQNIPNPFSNSTAIPYFVPYGSKGVMQIHNAAGALVEEYILQQGKNTLEVSMKELKAGTYFYSLVIDGEVKGSRKMVVE